ncbi:MAG: PBP1A family penicillin-binding protein [Vicinamibacteria bacterium]|nr:PBP1A family penicillin-binding protein [Vicinamibacteria bacterium]
MTSPPAAPRGRTYSPRRLRLVVILLTLITLPLVVGTSTLIYYYLRYSVQVEQRLQGERWLAPSRLFSRPVTVRAGMTLQEVDLQRFFNALHYEEKADGTPGPGQYVPPAAGRLRFMPRPVGDVPGEPLVAVFDKGRLKEIRGEKTRAAYRELTLERALLTALFDENREKRRRVQFEQLPEHLVQAVLAIEDRRFFSHAGLDPFRIIGAAVRNMRNEGRPHGGSTITQQLAKNFFLTPEVTLTRKLHEALFAFVLERRATKQEILELYLNEIYLGQVGSFSINGVGEASRLYFDKDIGNVNLVEAALLAGMIQSPNPYNPFRHPERAQKRRNQVLDAMVEAGYLKAEAADVAKKEPVKAERSKARTDAPYYVDLVRSQLGERYANQDLLGGNLEVQTSLDLHLQTLAEQSLARGLENVEKLFKKPRSQPVQGAILVIEPRTGSILALVGGRSYGASQYNRALKAKRQPGSTFKPFVYLAAFEATFDDPSLPPVTPATVVEDTPWVFFYEDKEYIPQNYEDEYLGHVTLRRALAKSLNVATVKVAEMVGYSRVADLWNKRVKVGGDVKPYPALALGSFEVTPLQMASAYTVFANNGLKVDPVTILKVADASGQVVEQYNPPPPRRVVHEESAFLVTHMLRSVVNEGSAAAIRAQGLQGDIAGKTGTTNDMRDAWFIGYTGDLLAVVWVGFDDNTALNLPGSRAALPIWIDFMKSALSGTTPAELRPPPENVVFVEIDKETGFRANSRCPHRFAEAFIAGTEPMEICQLH